MIIKTDKEGMQVIESLLDIALKQYGLKELKNIVTIIESIEELEDDKAVQDNRAELESDQ